MVSRGELFAQVRSLIARRDEETADFDTNCIFQDLLGERNPMFAPKEPVPGEKAAEMKEECKKFGWTPICRTQGSGLSSSVPAGTVGVLGLPIQGGGGSAHSPSRYRDSGGAGA